MKLLKFFVGISLIADTLFGRMLFDCRHGHGLRFGLDSWSSVGQSYDFRHRHEHYCFRHGFVPSLTKTRTRTNFEHACPLISGSDHYQEKQIQKFLERNVKIVTRNLGWELLFAAGETNQNKGLY